MKQSLRAALVVGWLGLLALGAWQYQAIIDWWQLRSYTPEPVIAQLSTKAAFSEEGERLFYLGIPELDQKATFSTNCPIREQSYTLGCYSNGRIYILNVERPELDGVMTVTAAHEMLHKAYERLSGGERRDVDALTEAYFTSNADARLRELIAEYDQVQPGTKHNELHSLLATQIVELPEGLEEYYSQYFDDREAVAEAYLAYESVFAQLESQIEALQRGLDVQRQLLESYDGQLSALKAQIDGLNTQLNQLLSTQQYAQYNSLVPSQNQAVRQYNALVASYQSTVEAYNQKVEELQGVVLEQSDLSESLDASKYTPLSQ